MASILQRSRKDGSPYWAVLYVSSQGKQTSSSFNDPEEAERFRQLVNQVGSAKAIQVWAAKQPAREQFTVAGWCTHHVNHLTGVNQATRIKYLAYIANDIAPSKIGPLPLSALTHDDMARWLNGLTTSGKTAANKHGFVAGALNAAVRAGQISANPCDGNRLRRDESAEMIFLTHAEFALLLSQVTEAWRPMVEFLAATGCRWGEASALKPSDVNLTEGTVDIRRAWRYVSGEGYVLGPPKTRRSSRTIDVAPATLAKLELSGEWVFTNSGRGRRGATGPVRAHNFNPNVWVPAVGRAKNAGLTKSPRVHDLRHTNASWLIQARLPLTLVQRHLGHQSIQTTSDRYGHLDRESSKVTASVIAKALNPPKPKRPKG